MHRMKECANYVWTSVSRRKQLDKDILATPLKRCLTWWHLSFFGIGQMAGAGVYVLTGAVAVTNSGPATFISYIIAGACAFLSALAYAEFGARCPKAGSAYTYAYITVGELIGFSIGWNLLLEHCIGAASTARAWGGALNALSSNAIKNWTVTNIGQFEAFGLSQYPDFFAVLIVVILTVIVCYGAHESMTLNIVVATVNMGATLFVAALGFYLAEPENWVEPDGFMPFGLSGVLGGAAMCFYAYVGYDGIAAASEETINPATALPLANAVSMITVMGMYVLMSVSLTLTVPYNKIDVSSPFGFAFQSRGYNWSNIIVTLASLVAITGTTLGNLFAVPRCAYAMASDGLLFRSLAYVNEKTRTPIVAILAFSAISALCALLLDLETLAEMVSLGTLMASFSVSACVIILRYQPKSANPFYEAGKEDEDETIGTVSPRFAKIRCLNDINPGELPKWMVLVMSVSMLISSGILLQDTGHLVEGCWWVWTLGITGAVVALASLFVISIHVQNDKFTSYKMPLSPYLPALSMFVTACLLARLSPMAWVRFIVWMAVGFLIYFGYGIRNSEENRQLLKGHNKCSYQSMENESDPKDGTLPDDDE